jgi:hypothetical protein
MLLTRNNAKDLRSSRSHNPTLGQLFDFTEVAEAVHAHTPTTPEEYAMNMETEDQNDAVTETPVDIGCTARDLDAGVDWQRHDVGEDVFDLIPTLTRNAQSAVLRGLYMSILAAAIFRANLKITLLEKDNVSSDVIDSNDMALARHSELACALYNEALALAENQFEEPMRPGQFFDFITRGEAQPFERDQQGFEALLASLELGPSEQSLIRDQRKKQLAQDAKKQRETMLARREEILDEVLAGFDTQGRSYEATDLAPFFDAREHAKFFSKAVDALKKASLRALKNYGKYENASSDVLDFNGAAKRIDTASAAFRRRNASELRTPGEDLRA